MAEKHVRMLAWLGSLLVFFPIWISAQRLFSHVVMVIPLELPRWLHGLITLLIFGTVLLGVSYAAASWLNRRYPDSPARSASWDAPQ